MTPTKSVVTLPSTGNDPGDHTDEGLSLWLLLILALVGLGFAIYAAVKRQGLTQPDD